MLFPEQIVWVGAQMTDGSGLTVMVKEVGFPMQVFPEFVKSGVTAIVAVTGALVMLVAVKEAISPEPVAASPMEISEFNQV